MKKHLMWSFLCSDGELLGVLYFRITPDFSFLTAEITSSFDKVALIFSALILVGLIAIFIVSSRAVRERNKVQEELFVEHEENLEKQIRLEKESLFTKAYLPYAPPKQKRLWGSSKMMSEDETPKISMNSNNGSLPIPTLSQELFMTWVVRSDINTDYQSNVRTNVNS